MRALAIARLLEADYRVFIPINATNELAILKTIQMDNSLEVYTDPSLVLIVPAIPASAPEPYFRVPLNIRELSAVVAVQAGTRRAWLIPTHAIPTTKTVRLGRNYDRDLLHPADKPLLSSEAKAKGKSRVVSLKGAAKLAAQSRLDEDLCIDTGELRDKG